jgi:hypothetical protein
MKLLDTGVIIGILRGDEKLSDLVKQLHSEELATTTLTYFELFSRVYHRNLKREERIIRGLLKLMNVLEVDEAAADKAAEIMGKLLRIGRPVNVIDVLIYGVALSNGIEEILTKDKNFKITEEIYGYPKITLYTKT